MWRALAMTLLLVAGASSARPAAAADDVVPTEPWGKALAGYQHAGGLDYVGLAADRAGLDAFLASLASARPEAAGKEAQKAFWLNAYNAVVAHQVLARYPGISSVKKVDGFFDRLKQPVAGAAMTLDEIEGKARALGDPRVHFAVVCASTSCPDLRGEAYRAADVDAQLEDQTRRFLANPAKGLRYDEKGNDLWLSSIFKWYAGDFTGGSTVLAFFARGGLVDWILPHLPELLAATLEKKDPSVSYLDYDWSLNDRQGH